MYLCKFALLLKQCNQTCDDQGNGELILGY